MLSGKSLNRWLFGLVTACCVVSFAVMFLNSLRRPQSQIRNTILSSAPLGSTWDDVVNLINKNGWESDENPDRGVLQRDSRGHMAGVIGSKSITASLGSYSPIPFLPVAVHVYAEWAFDADGKLAELSVKKEVDGP